jgi:hypothetical protein
VSSPLASALRCGSSARLFAPRRRVGGRQSMRAAYVDTDGGRHGEGRARACGCDLCGSAMSNGGYSGATKGDSSLCVVRKAVTAASRRIAEVGRRSCRSWQDSCGPSRFEHGPPNLLRRDLGDSHDDRTPTRLGHSLNFQEGQCLGRVKEQRPDTSRNRRLHACVPATSIEPSAHTHHPHTPHHGLPVPAAPPGDRGEEGQARRA